jgi:hypothetical protein
MRAGIPPSRTRMLTCRSRAAESLSRRQCITLCDSTAETECTPDIYRVIPLRTAASACQSNTPLRFLMPCRSGLPSLCSAGHQSTATTQANRNRVFHVVHVSAHSWVRAFRLRLLQCGGGKSICRVRCLSGGNSAFQMRWGQRRLQLIAASFLRCLAVGAGAGGLGPVRKLNKISQDIKGLVALRID